MRRNFELFEDFIGVDIMKRGINTLFWPYCSVAMYDKMKKVCIECEGTLCDEREVMYQFACHFMAENAPSKPLSEVIAAVIDSFFDQELVKKLGFVDAHSIQHQLAPT